MYGIESVMITRIIISFVLGGLIGIERELSHKPAGLKTHILVSMGSALFTTISIFNFPMDSARMVANIITGIGFIGAGAIIGSRGHVQGITTSATIWIAAAIGIAVGVGYYTLATTVAIISLIALLVLRKIEFKILRRRGRMSS